MSAGQPAIEFKAVSKSFGSRAVLKDISFSITEGTAFVLLGRSGTGKSVTLKLMCSL
ncbi:MAG: ATP-binding cassette domain-containing protein, partial [Acidobacteria bacterium]|nr:ATP-binding cassette domain-containing protein [Acidobacteriota bacterium]